jgi:spore coat protein U-like protein
MAIRSPRRFSVGTSRGYGVFSSSNLRLLVGALSLALFAVTGQPALAQTANLNVTATVQASCTLEGGTLAFGTYNATAGDATDSSAAIAYTCTEGTNITVSLNDGDHAEGAGNRAMAGPGGTLLGYGLYKEDSRTNPWGAGPVDGVTPPATSAGQQTLTVYGRIPPGQQAAPGAYSDIVQITLNINP